MHARDAYGALRNTAAIVGKRYKLLPLITIDLFLIKFFSSPATELQWNLERDKKNVRPCNKKKKKTKNSYLFLDNNNSSLALYIVCIRPVYSFFFILKKFTGILYCYFNDSRPFFFINALTLRLLYFIFERNITTVITIIKKKNAHRVGHE